MRGVLIPLLAVCLLFLASSLAQAQITISATFTLNFESGSDPHGLGGSTWTMSFDVADTYIGGSTSLTTATEGTLDVSGSLDVDGSYVITSDEDPPFDSFSFIPNQGGFGVLAFALDGETGANAFTFAGISITNFSSDGASVVSPQPPPLSPVSPSDFDGAIIGTSSFFGPFTASSSSGTGQFSFTNGTVTAVPEPSSVAFLGLGLGALYLARRRR